ncbi:uncharacterized protein LOC116159020 [Photinus pyralis]|nr:uncharacterized protein LOC116159020 [Photinus pyralis]
MKTLIYFCVCAISLACAASADMEEKIFQAYQKEMEPYKEKCQKETGADPLYIEVIMKTGVVSKDPKVMCFAKCMFMNVEVMDKDGKFKKEVIVKKGVAITDEMAESCMKSSESEPELCKRSHDFAICIAQKLAKL